MVKTKTLEPGVANEPYYNNIVVDNVEGAVKFEIVSGTLPDGITLSKDGAFAGTPTKNGSYTFTVKISDDVSSIQKNTRWLLNREKVAMYSSLPISVPMHT